MLNGLELPVFEVVGKNEVKSENMFFAEIILTPENLSSDVDFQAAAEILKNSSSDIELELTLRARSINTRANNVSQTTIRVKRIPARSLIFFD